ncbi:MAG: iron ABC transporter permease [Candidatus Tectomicrobia bacterium]|uniref:Iron ABC transporter permease n=1 Tax=Tectimicrobiota bacterium TaxID=2528274 RepID=A0A932M008_UNCTE|nr:iron ABC transporter permease [Candidatus Tectomicrobia bacterium]
MKAASVELLRPASSASWWRDPFALTVIGIAVVLAFLSIYPTAMLFYGSFTTTPLGETGKLSLSNYVTAYTDPETFTLLLDSFVFALGASAFSLLLALTLAWVTVRTNAPFRGIFELTAIVPNILPPVLIAISWTLLLSPSVGLLNAVMKNLFHLAESPLNIYSLPGLMFVEGLILTPLAFLIINAALRGMDPALEESARILGSNQFQIVRRVTFPLMRPAILAAGTLNFVRALESFDTPAIIALPARIEVFTTKIYREALAAYPPNYNLAATYGVSLLAVALVFVVLYRRFTSRVETFATVTGKGYRPHTIDLGRWKFVASAGALGILTLMVILPIVMLFLISILPYYHVPTLETIQLATLKHYAYIFKSDRVYRAIGNSLFLAVSGATAAMFLAALTAYITVKTKVFGRGILEGLTFLPWAFPSTALAIGLLWGYVRIPLPIYATIWILLIAYVTRFLPYGLRSVSSTIVQIHRELEEASRACGGGFWTTLRRILFPLMRPGLIAGWILLATIFMREFSLSLFLYTPSSEPVGPLLYFLWLDGLTGPLGALGILVSLVSAILVAVARRYSRISG